MEQKITIIIGGKTYAMTARSPEEENTYRLAATSVNHMLSYYTDRFPGKDMIDILALTALNESIRGISTKKKMDALAKEVEALKIQTDTYLDNIEEK